MKIFYAAPSPFVRKCLVTAHELGLRERIELVPAAAHPVNRDPKVVAKNPLGKIPTLVTDEGVALFDSRVICEYLNELGGGRLIPAGGAERWRVLADQALADGIMDAAILIRYESAVQGDAKLLVHDPAVGFEITWNNDPERGGALLPYFWPIREFVFALLRNRVYPLWQRMFLLGSSADASMLLLAAKWIAASPTCCAIFPPS